MLGYVRGFYDACGRYPNQHEISRALQVSRETVVRIHKGLREKGRVTYGHGGYQIKGRMQKLIETVIPGYSDDNTKYFIYK